MQDHELGEEAAAHESFDADWSTAVVQTGKRCSQELWNGLDGCGNNCARTAHEAKCNADANCKGLMYTGGGDGRTKSSGYYQGCGGTLEASSNDGWDTIVKPPPSNAHQDFE